MAIIKCSMSALGLIIAPEKCTGCEKQFSRGETMSAVEYDNDEPAGWFCNECIKNWNTQEKK